MSLTKLIHVALAAAVTIIPISTTMAAEPTTFASFNERAEKGDNLNVIFFGGSLTWGANASDPLITSYRGLMMDYLIKKYPKAHFNFVDAAIGGTGSSLGLFRLERDVMKFKPDLVFLDFTMNDGPDEVDPQKLASYEHLVREIVKSGSALQPVITTFKFFVDKPEAPKLPLIDDHTKLALAYGVPPANIHQAISKAVQAKQADVAVLWPFDGAHPDDPGYKLFFEEVRNQFEKNLAAKVVNQVPGEPVFAELYPNVERQILADLPLPKGWTRAKTRRTSLWFDGLSSRWMGDVAEAKVTNDVIPEPLELKFKGSMVGLFGERDGVTVPFRAWIDGQPVAVPQPKPKVKPEVEPEPDYLWKSDTSRFAPPKAGSGILFSWILLAKDLKDGEHTLRIEPVFENADPKADLRIESVCSAGK